MLIVQCFTKFHQTMTNLHLYSNGNVYIYSSCSKYHSPSSIPCLLPFLFTFYLSSCPFSSYPSLSSLSLPLSLSLPGSRDSQMALWSISTLEALSDDSFKTRDEEEGEGEGEGEGIQKGPMAEDVKKLEPIIKFSNSTGGNATVTAHCERVRSLAYNKDKYVSLIECNHIQHTCIIQIGLRIHCNISCMYKVVHVVLCLLNHCYRASDCKRITHTLSPSTQTLASLQTNACGGIVHFWDLFTFLQVQILSI